jgi:hypothetical protein
MLRRAFLAAVALLLTRRLSSAQQRPSGEQTVPEVLNIQGLITQTLRIATRVEDGAEQMLREAASRAFGRIEVPNVRLRDLAPARVPDLFIGQGSLSILLLTVLQIAKTADGQIIVTRQAVEKSLREHCPLYPFC